MNQVVGESICDRGQGSHAAGHDNHAERHKRAAGNSRALIAKGIIARRETLDFFDCVLGFVDQRTGGPFAHHQMGLDA